MSMRTTRLRRRRSEMEDDEDAGIARSSQSSTPMVTDSFKRARIERNTSRSPELQDAAPARQHRRAVNGFLDRRSIDRASDGGDTGTGKFQPGAIVRVKLTDFVTYANAEFFPGPNLNMIIGPNGTGKSSLVCAICLGLGWPPNVLGRASQIGEFVKHGLDAAYVEIELQCRDDEPENHVVRLKIIRDGNGREWFLNGKKTSLKAVQLLTKSLSIQIDNLCQFLPQDKVSEFAALSPVELLLQTQRAAAPEQMLEWHEELKNYRQEQKQVEEQIERDKEALHNYESRQETLEAEVQRLRERHQIQENVALLKKTIPVVEFSAARHEHKQLKKEQKMAERRLAALKEEVEPTMHSIDRKHRYAAQIKKAIGERKKALQEAELAAEKLLANVQKLDENVVRIGQEGEAERKNEGQRRKDLHMLQRKLEEMEERLRSEPISFDGPEWNEKIRAKDHEARDIGSEIEELKSQDAEAQRRGRAIRAEIEAGQQELAALDSQSGQQISKIGALSRDTAIAWKWVQENQESFEQEVYGPPLVTCSLKDPRYGAAVESSLRRNDVLTITAQTQSDFNKLSAQLLNKMALGDVTIRSAYEPLARMIRRTLSDQDLRGIGLDGWALDYVDGPEPVLAMLCGAAQLDSTAVSLEEINDDQYKMLASSSCRHWVAGRYSYNINKRAEYGPQATSTATKPIRDARYWTDRPIDTSARREIEARIQSLNQDFNEIKEQVKPAREKRDQLIAKLQLVKRDSEILREQKAKQQRLYGEYQTLPQNIARQKESIARKEAEGADILDRMKRYRNQHDHAVLRKAEKTLMHKAQVSQIRECHEELLDAEIRFIEATSDVEALKERNKDTMAQVQEEENNVDQAAQRLSVAYDKAQGLLSVCQEIWSEAEAAGNTDYFKNREGMSVETLEVEIAAEESKLEFIHASNPNAIRDFERRQLDIDRLRVKVDEANEKLQRINRHISKVRDKWEPELDKLIAEISDAFSYNFEQIGCAGEVAVHKDEDFDQWAIQIKVKFRQNETLQILDQHRQSGGERSVSTIFYLMSLQSLARAPFRVVDEINQGMDPRNERMVHERMVEIACKEHTSQYFLITPKLLTNLRYHKRMKVHCIASGEYMPQDHNKMNVRKIIAMRKAIVAAKNGGILRT